MVRDSSPTIKIVDICMQLYEIYKRKEIDR